MGDMSSAPTLEMSELIIKFNRFPLVFFSFGAMACARISVVELGLDLDLDAFV